MRTGLVVLWSIPHRTTDGSLHSRAGGWRRGLGAGQMGHPERGSACQAQTGWSYYSGPRLECGAANTPTHTSSGESTLSWLTITGWLHFGLCVCFHLWFHSCFNWKYQTSCWFPMKTMRKSFSHLRTMTSQDNGSSLLFHNGRILPVQVGASYSPYFQMCFSRLVVNIIYKVSFDDIASYLETHIQSKLISSLILNTI